MLEERILVIFFKTSWLHTKNHILHLDQPLQLVLPLLILGQRQQQLLGKLERKNRCQLKIINPQGKVERKFKEAVGLSKITGGLLRRIFRSLFMKLNSTFVKLTGIVLTSPSSFFFQKQLSHLSPVVNRVAQCCCLDRELDRQQLRSTRSPPAGLKLLKQKLLMRRSWSSLFAELDTSSLCCIWLMYWPLHNAYPCISWFFHAPKQLFFSRDSKQSGRLEKYSSMRNILNQLLKIFTPEKYSLLKNSHPWKIFTPEKYSPLKNIHPWKRFTSEKYSPLKNIHPKNIHPKNIHPFKKVTP